MGLTLPELHLYLEQAQRIAAAEAVAARSA
jgi:hypothetical protein